MTKTILQQIKELCIEHRYDEAIALAGQIKPSRYAIDAYLLCVEHEQACIRDGSYKPVSKS